MIVQSEAPGEISYFSRNVLEFWDLLKKDNSIYEEGSHKIENCRYINSKFYKLFSEEEKQNLLIDTINHPVDDFSNTVTKLETEVNDAEAEISELIQQFNSNDLS